jgi:hypothetical protein
MSGRFGQRASAAWHQAARALCHALWRLAARGGRLHRPDDAKAEPREAGVRRRAAALVGQRAAGSPRLQQRRRATAPPGCSSGTFSRPLGAEGGARSKRGCLVICDMGGEHADTAVGEFQFSVMSAVNRLQIRQATERYETSRRDAIRAGKWIGPMPPGYVKVRDGERRGNLDPDPQLVPIVREAYELAAGEGLHAAMRSSTGRYVRSYVRAGSVEDRRPRRRAHAPWPL